MIDSKILGDIRNQRCILFLGPLMTTVRSEGKGTSLSELVCSRLSKELVKSNILSSDNGVQRNPYYVNSKYINFIGGRKEFEGQFERINSEFVQGPSYVYYRLSKIPFNTIINFGYDHLMERALIKGGYEFRFDYYNYCGDRKQYLKDSDEFENPLDKKTQLVYNLLGSIYNAESQIYTEDDQLEFMRQIAGDRRIPDNVLSRIRDDKDGKSYIFLGFNFEEWPFRFLLDLLDVPKKMKKSAYPKLNNYTIALATQEFYTERFGLEFIDSSPEEFARELIIKYNSVVFDHKYGYVSYHDSDEQYVKDFQLFLQNTGLSKRIKFWSKRQIMPGDIKEEAIRNNLDKATIYIPFINKDFLNDPALQHEMKVMMAKPNVMIFPVITKNCDYLFKFPDLKRKSAMMLPKEDSWLATAVKQPSDEDYVAMIKKINSKIR
ncbi:MULTISPECIES: SIR2 family protein [Niastella]|uniref:Toll/interleukin-1 receptor domain-containing protein n=1 Tax=Niastella soli TaxID=2821487 RepID=A0ABS3Z124_9BACT|nr:SIR2 family protein [Niastella soli]MBO9203853.1 toll/interleukin-1 receptor domain-containing protein [Niastella soli]